VVIAMSDERKSRVAELVVMARGDRGECRRIGWL